MARFTHAADDRTDEPFADIENATDLPELSGTSNIITTSKSQQQQGRFSDWDTARDPFLAAPSQSRRSSSDGSAIERLAERARPRRRRPWLTRLLMSLRERRKGRGALGAADGATLYSAPFSARKRHISVRTGAYCLSILILVLAVLGVIHIVNFILGLGPAVWDDYYGADDWFPRFGSPGYLGEGYDHYPTDFTRDVLPIPCHSHNDYWRRRPLFDALHYGCTSVEADVWWFAGDEKLYVGHNVASLTENRTFTVMYVDPILRILEAMNGNDTSSDPSAPLGTRRHAHRGVFDEDPSRTLVLLVDFKNDGRQIWRHVTSQLSPLRDQGYLTHWNGTNVVPGAVTVVGTGNTPFDLVTANTTHRSIFFDAPLADLYEEPSSSSSTFSQVPPSDTATVAASQGKYNPTNSYYASTNLRRSVGFRFFGRGFTANQLRLLRGQVRGAHSAGLKARYWGAVDWPVSERNRIWRDLADEGVDVVNADDLLGASRMDWRPRWERY